LKKEQKCSGKKAKGKQSAGRIQFFGGRKSKKGFFGDNRKNIRGKK